MNVDGTFETEIRAEIARGRLVPVVGAGISIGSAGLPSWSAAVASAAKHLSRTGVADPAILAEAEHLLSQGELVPAATIVAGQLADVGEWPAWLRATFRVERDEVHTWSLLSAIFNLMAPVLCTTNYDRILSFDELRPRTTASWDQPAELAAALKDGGGVIHLHGVFDRPESVIFSSDDYGRLTNSDAYRSVLRTLWLDRTLLFVGCSFDGMQDPDFGPLLEWALQQFGPSPFPHYALLRTGTYDLSQAQHLLRQRIRVVEYGPGHERLVDALNAVNPHRERALDVTAGLVRGLIERQDSQDVPRLRQLLHNLMPDGADTSIAATAGDLIARRRAHVDRQRQELFALQSVAVELIDRHSIRDAHDRLERNAGLSFEDLRAAGTVALRAWRAWQLFPATMLRALKLRGVQIHGAVLTGHVNPFLIDAERMMDIDPYAIKRWRLKHPLDDAYTRENMQRVLRSVDAILAVDPLAAYPATTAGYGVAPDGPTIMVARSDRIELRALANPALRAAVLVAGPPNLHSAQLLSTPSGYAVVAHSRAAVTMWRPRQSLDPLMAFEVEDPGGIRSVASIAADDGIHSYVLTDRAVHHLIDADHRDTLDVPDKGATSIAVLPGHILLYTDQVNNRLTLCGTDGQTRTALTGEALAQELIARGALPDTAQVKIGDPHVTSVGDRVLLCLDLLVDREIRQGYERLSGALVCDPLSAGMDLVAYTAVPAEMLSFIRLQRRGTGFRALCGVQPYHHEDAGAKVFWTQDSLSHSDFMLLPIAGSAVTARSVRTNVAWVDDHRALAATDGALHVIELATATSSVVDADENKNIQALEIVTP